MRRGGLRISVSQWMAKTTSFSWTKAKQQKPLSPLEPRSSLKNQSQFPRLRGRVANQPVGVRPLPSQLLYLPHLPRRMKAMWICCLLSTMLASWCSTFSTFSRTTQRHRLRLSFSFPIETFPTVLYIRFPSVSTPNSFPFSPTKQTIVEVLISVTSDIQRAKTFGRNFVIFVPFLSYLSGYYYHDCNSVFLFRTCYEHIHSHAIHTNIFHIQPILRR